MPWGPSDATKHTHKADTPEKQKKWSAIADAILRESGDEGKAIRIANAKVGKGKSKS